MTFMQRLLPVSCAVLLSLPLAEAVMAASGSGKLWPCVQRKRLDLSTATMWTGPEVSETDKSWQENKEVADLVKQLAKRRLTVEDAEKLIDEAAGKMSGGKKETLTLVFAGLFQTVNSERRLLVSGIEKYAAKQIALSDKIKKTAEEVDKLGEKEELTDEDEKRLDTLNETLQWDTRIYDERNSSLEFVCESPVLLEQRLYTLAKKIQENLN